MHGLIALRDVGTRPTADLWWKIPLTCCVPFLVATYGAISNGHRAPGMATRPPYPTPEGLGS